MFYHANFAQYIRFVGYVFRILKEEIIRLALIYINLKLIFQTIQGQSGILYQCLNIPYTQQPSRNHSKHWHPKFKWLRQKKFIKVDLPNFQEKEKEISQEERNRRMKERGVLPARPWSERPILLSAVSGSI